MTNQLKNKLDALEQAARHRRSADTFPGLKNLSVPDLRLFVDFADRAKNGESFTAAEWAEVKRIVRLCESQPTAG